jgi:uncharacterized membrane protein YphA (DoxX/SURF4 family)
MITQGLYYFRDSDLTPAAWVIALVSITSGALLLVGFLTPVAGVIAGLAAVGIGLSVFPVATRTLVEPYIPLVFAIAILMAIVILGPGAFSVDALLFGRREIIIPVRTPLQQ